MSTATDWNCVKWADCTCAKSGNNCGCGNTCGCGTVTIEDVQKAMAEVCPKSGCTCGGSCMCKKDTCTAAGGSDKTREDWVDYVKASGAGASAS